MWTSSSVFPVDRVRIFDRNGMSLAEFRTSIERSYVLSDEGRARFTYATRKTDIVNDRVLNYGNWILIENNILPPWVGVIDTPREWDPRSVTVYAYTPEHVFGWRRGGLEETIKGSAGEIFKTLVNKVNQAESTILRVGDIWRGSVSREETLNPTLLNENLRRIQERSLEEYQWTPEINESGRLIVYADWAKSIGKDTGALLHEGRGGGNIEAVGRILIEDGDIVNDLLGYGEGETWKTKPVHTERDKASIGQYGLRQGSEEFVNTTQASVRNNTKKRLSEYSQPPRAFRLNALNVGDTLSYVKLGNKMTLRFQNMGFGRGELGYESTVRIIGMVYDPETRNKVELTVVEVLSNE